MKTQTEIVDDIVNAPESYSRAISRNVAIALLEAQLKALSNKHNYLFDYSSDLREETEHNLNRLRGENDL